MDTSRVSTLLEQLDGEIDDLEESLAPLVATALSDTASKLPLLDKAKLYVLVTYAIESVLFSYLRLNGVEARGHPVFRELTRVKQYFAKIKLAENPVGKRDNLSLDKGAAARIIKAGLSGNDKLALERAEQQAKERARAHIKFEELSEKMKQDELSKKRKADAQPVASDTDSESDSESSAEEERVDPPSPIVSTKARKSSKSKKQKKTVPKPDISSTSDQSSGRKNKKKKKKQQHQKQEAKAQ